MRRRVLIVREGECEAMERKCAAEAANGSDPRLACASRTVAQRANWVNAAWRGVDQRLLASRQRRRPVAADDRLDYFTAYLASIRESLVHSAARARAEFLSCRLLPSWRRVECLSGDREVALAIEVADTRQAPGGLGAPAGDRGHALLGRAAGIVRLSGTGAQSAWSRRDRAARFLNEFSKGVGDLRGALSASNIESGARGISARAVDEDFKNRLAKLVDIFGSYRHQFGNEGPQKATSREIEQVLSRIQMAHPRRNGSSTVGRVIGSMTICAICNNCPANCCGIFRMPSARSRMTPATNIGR